MVAEQLLDGEAKALTRKVVELALAGDTVALKLCLERILPIRRGRPVPFALPPIESVFDLPPGHGRGGRSYRRRHAHA